ncbi:MAG: energy transducer TonB, partial [Candidatus Zixiibacteriota bacterium]
MSGVNRSSHPCFAVALTYPCQRYLYLGIVFTSLALLMSLGYLWYAAGGKAAASPDSFVPHVGTAAMPEHQQPQHAVGRHRQAGMTKHGIVPIPVIGLVLPAPLHGSGYASGIFSDDPESVDDAGEGEGEGYGNSSRALFADTTIYDIGGPVQNPPELVWMRQPEYPAAAEKSGISGSVLLHVLVSERGKALEVVIKEEWPPNTGFGPATLPVASRAIFTPAVQSGYPVKCW